LSTASALSWRKLWLVALIPCLLILATADSSFMITNPLLHAQADGPTPAQGFNILSATWGTTSSPVEAGPGSVSVPLVVTFQYYYTNTATSVQATLSLPSGFTDSNGASSAIAFESGDVSSGTVFSLTYYLTVAQTTQLGSYSMPISISWGAIVSTQNGYQQSVSLVQNSAVTAYLKGKVQLSFEALQQSVTPGQVNNITMVLSNVGTGEATQISTKISAAATTSSSSSQSATVLSHFQNVGALEAGANVSQVIGVYVPTSASGLPLVLTISSNYTDAYGVSESASQNIGLYANDYVAPLSNVSLGVTPLNTNVSAGEDSTVSFLIKNLGDTPIYSPVFSLSLSSPLVTMANATYSSPGTSMPPGGSFVYEAVVTSSPTATLGTYPGSLSVAYSDSAGTHNGTKSFSVGFKLAGTITLVVQGELITEAPGNVTISGTLLNEGQTAAYYATLVADLTQGGTSLGNASQYVGEIDPNTPLPFSVTIPTSHAISNGTAGMDILVSYQDNFGQNQTFSSVAQHITVFQSQQIPQGGQTHQGRATFGAGILLLIIILLVVIVAVVSVLYVRRRRSKAKAGKTDGRII
jgi:hypothetical protein